MTSHTEESTPILELLHEDKPMAFWGNGGKLRTNDPRRQEETLLALTILLDAIVYDNISTYGEELKVAEARSPVLWEHIEVYGRYAFPREQFEGVHRPEL